MTNNTTRQKMIELRHELNVAKEVMVETVENLVHRAELIKEMEPKTRDMRDHAQEFIPTSNELKIKLRRRHSAISGAIICGILGVAYGLINGHTKEGAAIGAVIAGIPASMLGGLVGDKLGAVSGILERIWFRAMYTYRNFRPMQTLREKIYGWYYQGKMQSSINNAQEILAKYKKDEPESEKNAEKNQGDTPATPVVAVPAALNNTQVQQIVAHGFESTKRRKQKEEMASNSKKVASAHPRSKM